MHNLTIQVHIVHWSNMLGISRGQDWHFMLRRFRLQHALMLDPVKIDRDDSYRTLSLTVSQQHWSVFFQLQGPICPKVNFLWPDSLCIAIVFGAEHMRQVWSCKLRLGIHFPKEVPWRRFSCSVVIDFVVQHAFCHLNRPAWRLSKIVWQAREGNMPSWLIRPWILAWLN